MSVAWTKNAFVLGLEVALGNVHVTQVFPDLFKSVKKRHLGIEAVVVDAGYI